MEVRSNNEDERACSALYSQTSGAVAVAHVSHILFTILPTALLDVIHSCSLDSTQSAFAWLVHVDAFAYFWLQCEME
jgi:hypothetical protein